MAQVALWRPIAGTGRIVTSGSGSSVTDSVAMGAQTYACYLSAITDNVMITLQHGGVAATATTDMLLKTSDPPLILGCAPGDKIAAYGLGGAGVVYIVELTH